MVAQRQGQTAALNMLGGREKFDAVPFFWSQHYDVPINYVGHAEAWDEIVVDGDIAKPRLCRTLQAQGPRACGRVDLSRFRQPDGRGRDGTRAGVAREKTDVSKLRLTMACWNYDRTRALMDGSVRPDGIDLTYLNLPVEETFFRMLRHREFDVAEMSLSSYTVSMFREPRPFVAIPIFPSRFFRHNSIYINASAGIREPKDLIGKRIGTPEFQMTAPVWIRGILSDHYGVPVESVTYWTGGEEEPGRDEKIKLDLPSDHPRPADRTDADAGRDACATARSMRCIRLACRRRSPAATAR